MNDPDTMYISVIDFANSFLFLPAFDVGYFLAQFSSQFCDYPEILKNYDEKAFLSAYFGASSPVSEGFMKDLALFKLRANLSIANYLIRVGKGETREFRDLFDKSTSLMKELSE